MCGYLRAQGAQQEGAERLPRSASAEAIVVEDADLHSGADAGNLCAVYYYLPLRVLLLLLQ